MNMPKRRSNAAEIFVAKVHAHDGDTSFNRIRRSRSRAPILLTLLILPILRASTLVLVASFPLGAATAAGFALPWQQAATMPSVEEEVARDYPDVPQLPAEDFDAQRRASDRLILLDVREPAEYAVSHIPGAIRVDPDANATELLAAVGPLPAGATVVVYCSVGVRSSGLAARTQASLKSHGAASVANLRGGIFAWHNAHRPLVSAQGSTDAVHGYDATWARLLERHDGSVVLPK